MGLIRDMLTGRKWSARLVSVTWGPAKRRIADAWPKTWTKYDEPDTMENGEPWWPDDNTGGR